MADPIKALLDLKQALPNMAWHLEGDVLVTRTWLIEDEAQLLRDGQKMFTPRER